MTRCHSCPVPPGVPCFAHAHGLTDWCGDQPKWGQVILGRSLGVVVDAPGPEAADLHAKARDCPHARGEWRECGCSERGCRRLGKIVSGLDCLLCVAAGENSP
jgi:hypothetical protein